MSPNVCETQTSLSENALQVQMNTRQRLDLFYLLNHTGTWGHRPQHLTLRPSTEMCPDQYQDGTEDLVRVRSWWLIDPDWSKFVNVVFLLVCFCLDNIYHLTIPGLPKPVSRPSMTSSLSSSLVYSDFNSSCSIKYKLHQTSSQINQKSDVFRRTITSSERLLPERAGLRSKVTADLSFSVF